MRSIKLVAAIFLVAAQSLFVADQADASCLAPTDAEQALCKPSALHFCKEAIAAPALFRPFKVLVCLKEHRAQLSPACRGLLESCGQ